LFIEYPLHRPADWFVCPVNTTQPATRPAFVGEFVREYISPEQLEANVPEEKAYEALIVGMAAEIAEAAANKAHGQILTHLRYFVEQETRISAGDKTKIIADAAERAISLLVAKER
jgi:hypothetical protein